jgi:uncharacterized protein DUF6907
MSSPDEVRPYWSPNACPAWCDQLHSDADLVDDRRHVSSWDARVVLSTMEPVRLEPRTAAEGVEHEPCAVQVWVEQGYREVEPRVRVEEDHRQGVFAFSLAEAEHLAQVLAEAVKLGRGVLTDQLAAQLDSGRGRGR